MAGFRHVYLHFGSGQIKSDSNEKEFHYIIDMRIIDTRIEHSNDSPCYISGHLSYDEFDLPLKTANVLKERGITEEDVILVDTSSLTKGNYNYSCDFGESMYEKLKDFLSEHDIREICRLKPFT